MALRSRKNLRLAFMGTPDFSVPIISTLMASGHEVICVYTQPPRQIGRGQKKQKTPIHIKADHFGITVRTPENFSSKKEQDAFASLNLDCAVVVAYGLILPNAILNSPKFGCINIHASLLTRWRGPAPIQRAILARDMESGITIMQMNEGLDTGEILMTGQVDITSETTGESLHNDLSRIGCDLIIKALAGLSGGTIKSTPQPENGITYARKLERIEGRIDWTQSAIYVERLIRAFTPWPGAWFEVAGKRIKVLSAQVVNVNGVPGTVVDDKLTISCSVGGLQIETVQRAGKSVMGASEFLRGFNLPIGTILY